FQRYYRTRSGKSVSTTPKNYKTANPLTFGLALAGGIGMSLMIVALGYGVALGENADMGLVSGMFVIGLLMLLGGIIGWVAVVRPFTHFDDINVPQYTGHHDHGHAADEHALVVADESEHGHAA